VRIVTQMAIMKGRVVTAGTDGQMAAARPERIAGPAGRPAGRVAAGLLAATALMALAVAILTAVAWPDLVLPGAFSNLGGAVAAVAYATLGMLIVRRAGNLIGWIMLGEGAGQAFVSLASAYAVIGIATHPGTLPAAEVVGALAECIFVPVAFGIAFMVFLFPSGTLPSRRWRPVTAAGFLLAGLALAGLVVTPRLVALPAPGGTSLTFQNPLSAGSLGPVLPAVPFGTLKGLFLVVALFLAAAFVSLVVRYRAGGPLLRQQVKWLALMAVGIVICQPIGLLASRSASHG